MSYTNPLPGQRLARVEFPEEGYGGPPIAVSYIEDANLVTSAMSDRSHMHRPVLDIDMPVKVIPSSTPGHYHLFIDKAMTWEQYKALLRALGEVGILEQGYVAASIGRGFTAVRLPWIRKGESSR